MMKAVVFCNGEVLDYTWLFGYDFRDKLIICADGGVKYAEKIGLIPDIMIGDDDSSCNKRADAKEVILYPPEKDFTDTQLCIEYAIKRGCKEVELIGAMGGRHDQEFSHYCLMAYALEKGVRVSMLDHKNYIYMQDKPFVIKENKYKYVSFFPYGGDVEGFTLNGFKYKATGLTLKCSLVQATSNELLGNDSAYVDFKSGKILTMFSND